MNNICIILPVYEISTLSLRIYLETPKQAQIKKVSIKNYLNDTFNIICEKKEVSIYIEEIYDQFLSKLWKTGYR